MGDTIGEAVDQAVADLSAGGDTPRSPDTTPAPGATPAPTTAAASPPAALAAGPATGPQPPTPKQPAAGATVQTDDDGELLQSKDWLSLEKRRSILQGARERERTRERQSLLSTLGLAPETPLDVLKPHLTLMLADPAEYYRQLGDTLRARGVIQPDAPAAPPPPPAPPEFPPELPQPDLLFADGRRAYSDAAAVGLLNYAADVLRREFAATLEERLGPLQQTHEAVRSSQIRQQAHAVATDAISEASTWAHFDELKPQIAALMAADRRVTLYSAYNRLLQDRLKTEPARIREEARLATLKEIQSAPHSSTSIVPRTGAAVTDRSASRVARTMDDLFGDAVNKALTQHAGQLQ